MLPQRNLAAQLPGTQAYSQELKRNILTTHPKDMNPGKVFLTAQWRDLVMLNYDVDPTLLRKFVPAGTELDCWNGRTFLSLVGFRFLNVRVWGISFPFHSNFEEVNLRLYVRRREGAVIKRGVAFIREIVPRWAIANVARILYNENYVCLPMFHSIISNDNGGLSATYSWESKAGSNKMSLSVTGHPVFPEAGSEEQFISEHYWGYAAQSNGDCLEYQVTHPPWRVWSTKDARFEGDMEELYGKQLATALNTGPSSAFLSEGSEVTVYGGRRI